MATREALWPERTTEQLERESGALRHIAALLGGTDEWDDPAGYLEDIANIIHGRTGLPHPGSPASTPLYRPVR